VGTIFFRFVTIRAFDEQTDRQTDSFVMAISRVVLHAVARYKN